MVTDARAVPIPVSLNHPTDLVEQSIKQRRQENDIKHEKDLKGARPVLGRLEDFKIRAFARERRRGRAALRKHNSTMLRVRVRVRVRDIRDRCETIWRVLLC